MLNAAGGVINQTIFDDIKKYICNMYVYIYMSFFLSIHKDLNISIYYTHAIITSWASWIIDSWDGTSWRTYQSLCIAIDFTRDCNGKANWILNGSRLGWPSGMVSWGFMVHGPRSLHSFFQWCRMIVMIVDVWWDCSVKDSMVQSCDTRWFQGCSASQVLAHETQQWNTIMEQNTVQHKCTV